MKKILTLFIAIVTVLLLVSCDMIFTKGTDDIKNPEENNQKGNPPESSDKLPEGEQPKDPNASYVVLKDIVFTSEFSEGLAIVVLRQDLENFYVIDKSGKIAFTIKNNDFTNNGVGQNSISYPYAMQLYKNGKMLFIDGYVYDTVGNVITPEQVGATRFVHLKDGKYIVAEKKESTYDSMKNELGVLNMSLEWVLPLSEENHNLYYSDSETTVFWQPILGDNQVNPVDFDFSTITNCSVHTEFVNGKAGVMMYSPQSKEYFVSVINGQGDFLFTPQKLDTNGGRIYFDGNMLVVNAGTIGTKFSSLKVYCYNLNGEKIGSFDTISVGLCKSNSDSVTFSYSDGVVAFRISKGTYSNYYRQSEVRYYTCDFKELFAD